MSICVDLQDIRVTLKSDTFSFGVLMWEMATRMLPWQGLGLLAVSNPMTALSVELAEQSDDELCSLCLGNQQSRHAERKAPSGPRRAGASLRNRESVISTMW